MAGRVVAVGYLLDLVELELAPFERLKLVEFFRGVMMLGDVRLFTSKIVKVTFANPF